jgi:prophage regulatory protein
MAIEIKSLPSAAGHLTHSQLVATDRILRLKDVLKIVGLARSTVYKLIQESRFPAPLRLGCRAVGWPESSILQWLNDRLPNISVH